MTKFLLFLLLISVLSLNLQILVGQAEPSLTKLGVCGNKYNPCYVIETDISKDQPMEHNTSLPSLQLEDQ